MMTCFPGNLGKGTGPALAEYVGPWWPAITVNTIGLTKGLKSRVRLRNQITAGVVCSHRHNN